MAVVDGGLKGNHQIALLGGCVVTVAFTLARFTGAVREQTRVQRLLIHLADHDALTGLPNRRRLTDHLDREFEPVAETVILYLDLDGFKAVNDRHGHAAGDAVLVEVARRVGASIRREDLPVRLGGDEFAVLCPGLGATEGRAPGRASGGRGRGADPVRTAPAAGGRERRHVHRVRVRQRRRVHRPRRPRHARRASEPDAGAPSSRPDTARFRSALFRSARWPRRRTPGARGSAPTARPGSTWRGRPRSRSRTRPCRRGPGSPAPARR